MRFLRRHTVTAREDDDGYDHVYIKIWSCCNFDILEIVYWITYSCLPDVNQNICATIFVCVYNSSCASHIATGYENEREY